MTAITEVELKVTPFTILLAMKLVRTWLQICEIGITLHASAEILRVEHKCALNIKRIRRSCPSHNTF